MVGGIVDAFKYDVAQVIINCRANAYVYQQYSHRLVGDAIPDAGPCAGITALLAACQTPLLLILPCDVVDPPADLITRMLNQLSSTDHGVVLIDAAGRHNACVLLRTSAADAAWAYMRSGRRSLTGLFDSLLLQRLMHPTIVDLDSPMALETYRRKRKAFTRAED